MHAMMMSLMLAAPQAGGPFEMPWWGWLIGTVVLLVIAGIAMTRGYNSKPKQPKYRNLEK